MTTVAQPELRWHAVGRRKTSVARVYLTPGSGKWHVNGRTLGDYFPRRSLIQHIQQPFVVTDTCDAVSSVSAQAQARHTSQKVLIGSTHGHAYLAQCPLLAAPCHRQYV